MSTRDTRQSPISSSGVIAWAKSAASTATTIERMLGLCEVFKIDRQDGHEYVSHPDFTEVRKIWAARFTEMGGNLNSDSVKDPTSLLDTLFGVNANGINLSSFVPRGVLVQGPAYTPIRKPKPVKKIRKATDRPGELFGGGNT